MCQKAPFNNQHINAKDQNRSAQTTGGHMHRIFLGLKYKHIYLQLEIPHFGICFKSQKQNSCIILWY